MFPVWLVEHGEAVSFVVVAMILAVSARGVARLAGAEPRRVEDVYWWGAVLFIVAGRIAHVLATSPGLLTDVAVVIRFTDGIDPLAGASAAIGWVLGHGRGRSLDGSVWVAAVAGLTVAAATYNLTCPVREACFGVPVSAPLGFPMHGLVEPRLPTPVIEGVVLLVLLGTCVRLLDRWDAGMTGWLLLAVLAGVRLATLPLTAAGMTAPAALTLTLVGIGAAGLAWRSRHQERQAGLHSQPHPEP